MSTLAPPPNTLDRRFSDPTATATSWQRTEGALEAAELYWLTTVRRDGRPHVTPLLGLWRADAFHFCTGLQEQKARNLERHGQVAVTTGTNTWARGLDVVVEGVARRVTAHSTLQPLADAYGAKYGSDWHFEVRDGAFVQGEGVAAVFRVEPTKVLAFAKQPHGQTTFRFDDAGV
jgi:Pyridoxamine 5'-phosphate oxidase